MNFTEEFKKLSKDEKLKEMEKLLDWYEDFADCVQSNHRAYETACEYANDMEAERLEEE